MSKKTKTKKNKNPFKVGDYVVDKKNPRAICYVYESGAHNRTADSEDSDEPDLNDDEIGIESSIGEYESNVCEHMYYRHATAKDLKAMAAIETAEAHRKLRKRLKKISKFVEETLPRLAHFKGKK